MRSVLARALQGLRTAFSAASPVAPEVAPAAPAKEPVSLVCKLCGQGFVWNVGEQRFFESHGLRQPPSHCRLCCAWRQAPRATRGPAPGTGGADVIVCKLCQQPFTLRARRRAWFVTRGLAFPRTCRACGRSRKRLELIAELEAIHPELFLTGQPLGDRVAVALASGDLREMRVVRIAVRGRLG